MKSSQWASRILLGMLVATSLTVVSKPTEAAFPQQKTNIKHTSVESVESKNQNNATVTGNVKSNLANQKSTVPQNSVISQNLISQNPINNANQRLLYLGNDANGDIEIFDIKDGHKLIRSIAIGSRKFRGITAHAGTQRLYFTNDKGKDPNTQTITAIDLITEQKVWEVKAMERGCEKPDRLNVTLDGSALYIPCKESNKELILNASDGSTIKMLEVRGRPHNTFTGEQGKYMYMSARNFPILHIADRSNHTIIRSIKGFSSPVRPFSVNPSETYVFTSQTGLIGFGIADIRDPDPNNWKILMEVEHTRPDKLPPYINSPHGSNPQSHGVGVRPGGKEVWFIDDHYGFLYVYDITNLPKRPTHVATVPLFTDYSKPWTDLETRWVAFDIKGKYVYAPNGWVIDASTRKDTGMRITPSEKMVEVRYKDGIPQQASGQNGGAYPLIIPGS